MLQALDDETALADVARNAKLWEVRLAAVQRVTDSALLERIAEATKHRDDRVYRYSYDLLRMRRRDLARAALAAQLAAGFRGLIEAPPESRSLAAGQLRDLDKALAELRAEGTVQQEVIDLAVAAHERVHADVQALRELGAAAALAEALRAEIESAGTQANVAAFRERLAGLSGERPAWLAGHPTAAALASSLEHARGKLDEIAPPPAPAPKSEKKKEETQAVQGRALGRDHAVSSAGSRTSSAPAASPTRRRSRSTSPAAPPRRRCPPASSASSSAISHSSRRCATGPSGATTRAASSSSRPPRLSSPRKVKSRSSRTSRRSQPRCARCATIGRSATRRGRRARRNGSASTPS